MKILGENVNDKKVYKKIGKRVKSVRCDNCGAEILPYSLASGRSISDSKYYYVAQGHNDWGNDSADSITHEDVCSRCLIDYLTDILSKNKNRDSDWIEVNAVILGNFEYEYEETFEDEGVDPS